MKRLLLLITIIHFFQTSRAQTNQGTDFWLTPMLNFVSSDSFFVIISAEKATTAKVEIPLMGFSQNLSLGYNDLVRVYIPNSYKPSTANTIIDCGIHVTSFLPVSVYSLSASSATTDASCIFPSDVQPTGGEYYALNPEVYGSGYNSDNIIGIVCVDDSATIEITPATTTQNGNSAGVPFTEKLKQGQVYLFTSSTAKGLQGTYIKAPAGKRIAVFSGDRCVAIRCAACDHVYEEMPPMTTWGKNFVITPFYQQDKGYDYQVVASANGTVIKENGVTKKTLTKGEVFYRRVLGDSSFCLSSNEPILLVQYMTGKSCQTVGGDPAMLVINPLEQTIQYATVSTANTTLVKDHYLTIAVPKSGIDSVYLDGSLISKNDFDTVPCGSYFFYRASVTPGNHTIECRFGFICYLYGIGGYESYAYSAGIGLRNLKRYIIPYTYSSCDTGYIVKLTSYGDTANGFRWTFNKTQKDTNKTPYFYVSSPGTYSVKLLYKLVGKKTWDSTVTEVIIEKPKYTDFIPFENRIICDTQFLISLPKAPFLKYTWNTGDTTSDLILKKTGKYIVNIYNNITKCTLKDSCVVTFFDKVDAIFKYKMTSYCPGIPLYLYDSSRIQNDSIVSYSWYADKYLISNLKSDTVKSPRANKYDIKLIIKTQNGCMDSASAEILISDFPVAKMGIRNIDSCYKTNLFRFNSASTSTLGKITHLKWMFSNGDTVIGQQPQLKFKDSGVYSVRMVASTETGCKDTTDIHYFKVYPAPKTGIKVLDSSICLSGNYFDLMDGTLADGQSKTYLWDLGDGTGNTFQNPGKSGYSDTGTYTVKFVATYTQTGCGDTAYRKLKVIANPKASLTSDSSNYCLKHNYYAFTNTSSNNGGSTETTLWKWGDGTETVDSISVRKQYSGTGTFKVKMYYSTGKGCIDSATKNVIIYQGPEAAFSITDSAICGSSNYFNTVNNSTGPINARFSWTWDNNSSSLKSPGKLSFGGFGAYKIKMTITDPLTKCTDTAFRNVEVLKGISLQPKISDTVVCDQSRGFVFTDSTDYGNIEPVHIWKFSSTGNDTAMGKQITKYFNSKGSKTIQLIGGIPGTCADTVELNVRIKYSQKPVSISHKLLYPCEIGIADFDGIATEGNAWSWDWNFNGNSNAAIQNPSNIQFDDTGRKYILLTVTDAEGCNFHDTAYLNILENLEINIDNLYKDTQCMNGHVFRFVANTSKTNGPVNYNWDLDEGKSAASANTGIIQYNNTGIKNIKLDIIDSIGCKASQSVSVLLNESPEITVTSDSICRDETAAITANFTPATLQSSVVWYLNGSRDGVGPTYSFFGNNPSTNTIQAIISTVNGCSDTSNIGNIVVFDKPTANFGVDIQLANSNGVPVQFLDSSTGATQWTWYTGDGKTGTVKDFKHIYTQLGYKRIGLLVTNNEGCSDSLFKTLFITSDELVYIPNSFSPNGDRLNEVFKAEGLSAVKSFYMAVYNIWGEKMFETTDPTVGWDGNYKNEPAMQGSYAYIINLVFITGKRQVEKGNVTLLR